MESYNDVVKIGFLKKDSFGTKYIYELNIKENKEIIMDASGCKVNNLDNFIIKNKGNVLYDILKEWDKEYINPKILDGIEFRFVVEFSTGKMLNIYCKNKFPNNFIDFIKCAEEN